MSGRGADRRDRWGCGLRWRGGLREFDDWRSLFLSQNFSWVRGDELVFFGGGNHMEGDMVLTSKDDAVTDTGA